MKLGRSIQDILNANQTVLSVEFYPPKTEEGARQIIHTAKTIQNEALDFVSITYGAGGSTRERTLEYGELLRDLFDFEVMPHLTCVGHSREELYHILERFQKSRFRNIMTLRGDPPKGQSTYQAHPDGLRYASELVEFIRANFPKFCLGVAGYPEKHPEANSIEQDLTNLKHKVDQGADFITTQLFFNNNDYFAFVDNCRHYGITVPIIPGILPAMSFEQVTRMCGFCQASLPEELGKRLESVKNDPQGSQAIGIDWAYQQIKELLENGAPGVHLYILNRSEAAITLIQRLYAEKYIPMEVF